MTFQEAQAYVLHFGKYSGRTLEEVASSDSGLRYLDFLVGQGWLHSETREAVEVYLEDSSIASELSALLE